MLGIYLEARRVAIGFSHTSFQTSAGGPIYWSIQFKVQMAIVVVFLKKNATASLRMILQLLKKNNVG